MGYLFLLLTILSESTAVICMKLSSGFHNKLYTAIAIVTYALSFVFLTLSLKTLPAGTANAIWAGVSTILVALVGLFFLNENLMTIQIISMNLIAIGLVGLNLTKTAA